MECYIEVAAGQQFEVIVSFDEAFAHDGNNGVLISYSTCEGNEQHMVYSMSNLHTVGPFKNHVCCLNGAWYDGVPTFMDRDIDIDNCTYNTEAEIRQASLSAARIVVKIARGIIEDAEDSSDWNAQLHRGENPPISNLMAQMGITLGVAPGNMAQRPKPVRRLRILEEKFPLTFSFQYRSKLALKNLGLIPTESVSANTTSTDTVMEDDASSQLPTPPSSRKRSRSSAGLEEEDQSIEAQIKTVQDKRRQANATFNQKETDLQDALRKRRRDSGSAGWGFFGWL